MEVSDLRRRLRSAIDDAKKRSVERRTRVDDARRAWERLLPEVAVPTFHTMAGALTAEGHRFKVFTPGEAVRLSLERSAEEFVELSLDTDRDEPALLLRSTRGRGRRIVSTERIVGEGAQIAGVTQEDLVAAILEELIPFIER
jgi:hypothetical protein